MLTSTGGVGKLGIFNPLIFTLGYTSTRPDELKQIATDKGAFVLDIRLVRWSRAPQWREGALASLLTWDVYRICDLLGNVNYKGGPIELKDPGLGVKLVLSLLAQKPVILLCACWSHETCHRLVAANLVAGSTIGCEIEHLYGSRKEGR